MECLTEIAYLFKCWFVWRGVRRVVKQVYFMSSTTRPVQNACVSFMIHLGCTDSDFSLYGHGYQCVSETNTLTPIQNIICRACKVHKKEALITAPCWLPPDDDKIDTLFNSKSKKKKLTKIKLQTDFFV